MITLGKKAKDKITGFTGVITGRTEWLYSVPRVFIESENLSDGGIPLEGQWFEEGRIEESAGPTPIGFVNEEVQK